MFEGIRVSRYDERLWREINEILFRDWDPIGVNGEPQCEDEYESYIGGIYRLVTGGADSVKLAQHLVRLETSTIEVDNPDREERCRRVAEKLLALRS